MSAVSQEIARNRAKGGLDNPNPPALETPLASDAAGDEAIGADRLEQRRRERKPFGSQAQKLAYPQRAGYHRHWFNDVPGRIDRAKEAGYDHVMGEDSKAVKRPVGTKDGGGVLMAYLMEIPQDWYDDDMKAQQDQIDRQEKGLEKGKPLDTQNESQGAFYNGSQGRVTRFSRDK